MSIWPSFAARATVKSFAGSLMDIKDLRGGDLVQLFNGKLLIAGEIKNHPVWTQDWWIVAYAPEDFDERKNPQNIRPEQVGCYYCYARSE